MDVSLRQAQNIRQPSNASDLRVNPFAVRGSCVFASALVRGFWLDARTQVRGTPTGGTVGTTNRVQLLRREAWQSLLQSANGRIDFANDNSHNVTGPVTVLARVYIRTLTAGAGFVAKMPTGTPGTTNCPYWFFADTSGVIGFQRANATDYRLHTGGPVLAVNGIYTLAVSQDGAMESAPKLAVNGELYTMADTAGAGTGAPTTNTRGIWLGANLNSSVKLDGLLSLGVVFNERATDAELVALTRNPWQIFAPKRAQIFGDQLAPSGFNPAWAVGSNQYLGGGLHA